RAARGPEPARLEEGTEAAPAPRTAVVAGEPDRARQPGPAEADERRARPQAAPALSSAEDDAHGEVDADREREQRDQGKPDLIGKERRPARSEGAAAQSAPHGEHCR